MLCNSEGQHNSLAWSDGRSALCRARAKQRVVYSAPLRCCLRSAAMALRARFVVLGLGKAVAAAACAARCPQAVLRGPRFSLLRPFDRWRRTEERERVGESGRGRGGRLEGGGRTAGFSS